MRAAVSTAGLHHWLNCHCAKKSK